jgi:hypothetical protein
VPRHLEKLRCWIGLSIKSTSEKLARYVAHAAGSSSTAAIVLNPATRKPRVNPPAPENRSTLFIDND